MRILFDQGTPGPLRRFLSGHTIETAFERNWGTLQSGDLLTAAESAGFDAIITTDQSLQYQQNLARRRLAVVVLLTTDWRRISRHTVTDAAAVAALTPGAHVELAFPPPIASAGPRS